MANQIIQLPKRDKQSLIRLIELNEDSKQSILEALENSSPSLTTNIFISEIADRSGLSEDLVQATISIFLKLYNILDGAGYAPEKVSDIFIESLKDYEEIDIEEYGEDTLSNLREFVAKGLSLHSTLGVTAKALRVMTQHKNIYRSSELYTDIRPIFKSSSKVGKPQAAVLIHNLKINYYKDDERKSIYISLDSFDVEELIKTLERAQTKFEFLSEFLDEAELGLLNKK